VCHRIRFGEVHGDKVIPDQISFENIRYWLEVGFVYIILNFQMV
jgi:hypothetical protein